MNTSAEIEQLNADLRATVGQMALERQRLIEAAGEELRRWYGETVQQVVKSQPEVTIGLGADGLRALKGEAADLQERAGEIASTWLDDAPWPDRDESKATWWTKPGTGIPENLLNPWRAACAELGAVLEQNGYDMGAVGRIGGVATGENEDWWTTWPADGWQRGAGFSGPGSHYPYKPPVSNAMREHAAGYGKLNATRGDQAAALREAERSLREAEAGRLWDET